MIVLMRCHIETQQHDLILTKSLMLLPLVVPAGATVVLGCPY